MIKCKIAYLAYMQVAAVVSILLLERIYGQEIITGQIKVVENYWLAVTLYIGMHIAASIACYPNTPLICAAALVFPLPTTIISTVIGANLGAICGYYMGKGWRRVKTTKRDIRPLHKMRKWKFIQRYEDQVQHKPYRAVALLRCNIFIPFDLVNHICGYQKVSFKAYTIVSFTAITVFGSAYSYILHRLTNNI